MVARMVVVAPALALALAGMNGMAAHAQSAAAFYKGRTVTVVVPSGSGGSFHIYGQVVAHNLGRHIPGNPTVIVQNRPGAGGSVAGAYMMNAAPKDGTVIAEIAPGMVTDPLVRPRKYDARKFAWLGSVAARPFCLALWHTAPAKTVDDMKKQVITFGTNGRTSAGYIVPTFVNAVLGTKIKIITGYKSGGETNMAIERGEVQGRGNFYSGFTGVRPDWIKDKKLRFLLQIGPKHPDMAGVPHVRDFLQKGSVNAAVYELMDVNFQVGQAFYAPPGIAAPRLAVLRKAFDAMLADPATAAEIAKRRIEFHPQNAASVSAHIDAAFRSATPEVIQRFRTIIGGSERKKS